MSGRPVLAKLKEKLKGGKVLEIVVVLILAVVVLGAVYSMLGGKQEQTTSAPEGYAQTLERQLASVLSGIDGAGEVDVFVSVVSEGEKIVAMETTVDADGNTTSSPVLVGGNVVVLEERFPEITGVLIVAEGAESVLVRIRLLEAAASVLDIPQSKIKIYTKAGTH